jgi:hypothetical protein
MAIINIPYYAKNSRRFALKVKSHFFDIASYIIEPSQCIDWLLECVRKKAPRTIKSGNLG